MKDKNMYLEGNIFYRLIKVAYIFTLLLGIVLIGVFGWESKPESYVDSSKSYITCNNNNYNDFQTRGKTYTLDAIEAYSIYAGYLSNTDVIKAKVVCAYDVKWNYSYTNDIPNYQNYQLTIINSVRGDWRYVFIWWIVGFCVVYIVLNLIRETLIYIFFGRPFQWEWLARMTNQPHSKTILKD